MRSSYLKLFTFGKDIYLKSFKRCFNLDAQIVWSKYNPTYVDPVYKHDELEKLADDGIAQQRAYVPIKAAKSNETCSVFHDPFVNKFINTVMRHGNKELARNMVQKAFENIKRTQLEKYHKATTPEERNKIEINPVKIFYAAVANVKPVIHTTLIKRGGRKYQVPMAISDNQARFRAMKWLIDAGKNKHRKVHFPEQLAQELINAANNEGRAVKRKQDLHRQCEANRAYAHYRWG